MNLISDLEFSTFAEERRNPRIYISSGSLKTRTRTVDGNKKDASRPQGVFKVWRPLSGMVFPEESEFEVTNGPNPSTNKNKFKLFQ